jgi:glycosyltransferase involved in cell wall biosynthesis
MLEAADLLRRDLDLSACALDYFPARAGLTLRDELSARFGGAAFVRHRWQLGPALRGADVVLWYGLTNAIPRALAEMDRRPASIRIVHTQRPEEVSFHRRWRRVIDRTICVSPAVQRQIAGSVFIPNTCSDARLRGPGRSFFAAGPTLGWIGRLAASKNVDWLVENLGELGCNLLLQGIDTEELCAADLALLAERRGTAARLRFLPPGRDAGTLLRSVDALVIASAHEAFPMVLLEAGRLGVPVVSTRVGALPELFSGEVLFVDSAEGRPVLASMAQAIRAVEPSRGERLRERVALLCAPERVASRYDEVIREAWRSCGSGSASGPR